MSSDYNHKSIEEVIQKIKEIGQVTEKEKIYE